ncbi:ejaculatory bulb-specific protein 3-like [Schistocerca cancellata]|uniref:ejaculatory bulb-specific protein 3-like n=1 Tax=Schistocerca cancellata TaxID=274614 RepID=UPI0021188DB3|nr:ejaculatory bulb-specific protein 3-like [Schistocerca cancellata]
MSSAVPFLVFLSFLVAAIAPASAQDVYQTAYDNVDVDTIIQDDTLVQSIMKCLVSATDDVCDPANKHVKELLPEMLATGCAKCSEKQKHSMTKYFGHVSRKHPELFKQFLDKYDPAGEQLDKIRIAA